MFLIRKSIVKNQNLALCRNILTVSRISALANKGPYKYVCIVIHTKATSYRATKTEQNLKFEYDLQAVELFKKSFLYKKAGDIDSNDIVSLTDNGTKLLWELVKNSWG